MPLYDILNEFQKGSSHMAAVVKTNGKNRNPPSSLCKEKPEERKVDSGDSQLTTPLLSKPDDKPENVVVDIERSLRSSTISRQTFSQQNMLPRMDCLICRMILKMVK